MTSHRQDCVRQGGGSNIQSLRGGSDPSQPDVDQSVFKESGRFHLGTLRIYEYKPTQLVCLVAELFESVMGPLVKLLEKLLAQFGGLRVSFRVLADLVEIGKDFHVADRPIGSTWAIISHREFVKDAIFTCATYIILALNYYNEGSSNFAVERLTRLDVHVGEYAPLAPRGFLNIPAILKGRHGLLNIHSVGPYCFHYCILAHFFGDEMSDEKMETDIGLEKFSKQTKHARYKRKIRIMQNADNYLKYFETSGIDFSCIAVNERKGCSLHDIAMFEFKNEISVNVFGHKGPLIIPVRLTPNAKRFHVDLLIIEEGEDSHYVLITDLSRLLGNSTKDGRRIYCPQCLRPYIQLHVLKRHIGGCGSEELGTPIVPTENTFKFKRFEMMLPHYYSLYYFIEENNFHDINGIIKSTPTSYSLALVGPLGKLEKVEFYCDVDIVYHFIIRILEIAEQVREIMKNTNNFNEPTVEQRQAHLDAVVCAACKLPFSQSDPKAYNHCHISGNYINSCHVSCNLRIRMPRHLHAITLNTTNHSFHHIIRNLDSVPSVYKVLPIMRGKVEMAGLVINDMLKLMDIQNFRPRETLRSLSVELLRANSEFPLLKQFLVEGQHKFIPNLISHTPPQPISESSEQMQELKSRTNILPKEGFRNGENGVEGPITDNEYNLYLLYVQSFGCETLEKYIYFKSMNRSVLFAEIFERFRSVAYSNYELDPLHCWTISSYTFQCAFYFNRIEVGIVTDPDIAKLVDDLIRGGYQVINKKQVQSNTKLYGPYDPKKENCIIMYADIIQQYAFTMTTYLPDGNYTTMSSTELKEFNYMNPTFDTGIGYCFQVSLTLDKKYHDYLSQMPISPEHYDVSYESWSMENKTAFNLKSRRFFATLLPKTRKTYYYKTLAFMLKIGFTLTEVHQGFRFTESAFLRDYVHYNIKKRQDAENETDRTFFKGMVNYLSGKLLVNQLRYPNLKFCFSSVMARQLLSQENFLDVDLIDPNVTLFKFKKNSQLDINFRMTGAVILELAKLRLYYHYYGGLKHVFGPKLDLIFSNTDSLFCAIRCSDSEYLKGMKQLTCNFDFSNLPKNSPLYDESYRNDPGKLKICVHNIIEYIGLGVTTYSILTDDNNIIKCGGVPHNTVETQLRHEHFKKSIGMTGIQSVHYNSVRVLDHELFHVRMNRIVLRNSDISRVFINNTFSLPYGHYKLKDRENEPRVKI